MASRSEDSMPQAENKQKTFSKKHWLNFNANKHTKVNPRWGMKPTCWTRGVLDYVEFGTMQLRFTIFAKLFHSIQFLTIRQSQRRIRSSLYKTLVGAKLGVFFCFFAKIICFANFFLCKGAKAPLRPCRMFTHFFGSGFPTFFVENAWGGAGGRLCRPPA